MTCARLCQGRKSGSGSFCLVLYKRSSRHSYRKDGGEPETEIKELEDKIQSLGVSDEDKAKGQMAIAKLKRGLAATIAQNSEGTENAETQVVGFDELEFQAQKLRAGLADPALSPDDRAKIQKELAEREAQIADARDTNALGFVTRDDQEGPVNGKLTAIRTERVSRPLWRP
jgi:hypothetical protein